MDLLRQERAEPVVHSSVAEPSVASSVKESRVNVGDLVEPPRNFDAGPYKAVRVEDEDDDKTFVFLSHIKKISWMVPIRRGDRLLVTHNTTHTHSLHRHRQT